jgi:hypothetical protein
MLPIQLVEALSLSIDTGDIPEGVGNHFLIAIGHIASQIGLRLFTGGIKLLAAKFGSRDQWIIRHGLVLAICSVSRTERALGHILAAGSISTASGSAPIRLITEIELPAIHVRSMTLTTATKPSAVTRQRDIVIVPSTAIIVSVFRVLIFIMVGGEPILAGNGLFALGVNVGNFLRTGGALIGRPGPPLGAVAVPVRNLVGCLT